MSLTIYEVLKNAQYNLNNNGLIGMQFAKGQLDNALLSLENGKDLYDNYDEDFVEIALKIEGYSGSDISTLCREVSMLPLRELDTSKLMADSNIEEEEVRAINMDDFTKSIKEIKPSASKLDLREYEKWKNKYGE